MHDSFFWQFLCVVASTVFVASVGVVTNRIFEDVKTGNRTNWIRFNYNVVLPCGNRCYLVYIHPLLFVLLLSFGLSVLFHYLGVYCD